MGAALATTRSSFLVGLVDGAHSGHVGCDDGGGEFDGGDDADGTEDVGCVGGVGELVEDDKAEEGDEDGAAAHGEDGDETETGAEVCLEVPEGVDGDEVYDYVHKYIL